MDILNQIFLNILVLAFGLIFIFPFSSKANPPLHISLAWFTGWGIIVISEIVLVISGVYVTLPKIIVLAVFCIVVFWITFRNILKEKLLFQYSKLRQLRWEFAILLLLSISSILLLVHFGNYIKYTPDSRHYEALSRIFHKYGVYADSESLVFGWLFNIAMPFYIAIHNVAYLSGIKVFYSFMSTTTFFIGLGLWGFWRTERDQFGFWTIIWLLMVIALFLVNRLVIFHSFYLLTNLTTMAYYTFGILSLYKYLEKDKDKFWFILACFFLGCTGILRKEMLLFSLFPFFFVGWKDCFPKLHVILFGFILYFLFSYLWFLWGILGLIGISEVINIGFKTEGHGSLLIVMLCFMLSVIVFFFPWRIMKKRIKIIIYILSFVGFVVFTYYLKNRLIVSINDFYLLTFKGEGVWGSFWPLLFLGFFIYLFLRTLSRLFGILPIDSRVNLNNDKGMEFLAFVIAVFLIARLVLFAIFKDIKAIGFNYSGNRILLHIYPVALYFLGRVGFICTQWRMKTMV